jgi:MFS family permease
MPLARNSSNTAPDSSAIIPEYITPAVVYADYYGRASLGKIRGIGEIGVLLGQSTGPLLAGLVFDLRGSYTLIFIVFSATAAAGSLLVLNARRPVRAETPAVA